jgi:hypothetical protein
LLSVAQYTTFAHFFFDKIRNMISNSILLATLTSLLTLANAAPVSRASSGRPIKWTREDGQVRCLQVNPTTGGLKDQLFNGAHVGMYVPQAVKVCD